MSRYSRRFFALAVGLAPTFSVLTGSLPQAAQAQNAPAPNSKRSQLPRPARGIPSGANLGARTLIGPDDVLSISVLRHPEFSATDVVVPGNGLVALPVIGIVSAAGKSIAQFDAEITRRLKVRLLRPEVSVSITKPAPRPVYVVGQVRSPGVLEFKNDWRITQALAAAGGISVDSDLAAVAVSRGSKTVLDTPLLPILRSPSGPENIALRVGDTLRFYERVVRVNVLGAVGKPGIYAIPRGSGVVEAIGLAGGPMEAASLTRATLSHSDGSVQRVDLYAALRQGKAAQNLKLREGDVLSVPEFKDRVSVLGAVKTPGFYGLEDGAKNRVADILARAGSASNDAALTRATLRRANGQIVTLNLYRLLVLGENDNNLPLLAGDVLSIPESRGITVLGEVKTPGIYKIEEGTSPRASDALARAGGLNIKPEVARISVSRQDAKGRVFSLSLDAVGLLELSNPAQNSLLQDGDILSVSETKGVTVFINGQVKTPNAYVLKEGDGIAALLARAGGPTEDAALSRVAITARGGQTQTVNVASILLDGSNISLPLRDGDSVVVPRSVNRILIIGGVNKSGSYPVPEDRPMTIGEALTFAGGTSAGARAKEILIFRPVPGASPDSQASVQRLVFRLDKAENGQLAVVQPIFKGDVVYVPEAKVSSGSLGLLNSFLPAASFFLR